MNDPKKPPILTTDINIPLWGCVKCGRYIRVQAPPDRYACQSCRRINSYVKCLKTPTNPNGVEQ